MATDTQRDEFLVKLEIARSAMRERLSELRASIQQREKILTAELDRLEKDHVDKQKEYSSKKSSLNSIRNNIEEQFKLGAFEDLKSSILRDADRKIQALDREYPTHHVTLVWEGGVNEKIRDLGRIIVTVGKSENPDNSDTSYPAMKRIKTEINTTLLVSSPVSLTSEYQSRVHPTYTLGQSQLQCRFPQGVIYYPEDNSVFIVEDMSSCVYKFSIDSRVVQCIKFPLCSSVEVPDNKDMMRNPAYQIGVCIKNDPGNERVFISRRTRRDTQRDVIAAYALLEDVVEPEPCENTGCQHMYYIGKHGTAEGELNRPAGIAFDNPRLYVCDCKNNRVNVYIGFCNTSTITHRNMSYPLDVKIYCKAVFVLNSKPPYVLEFDATGILRSVFLCNYILCDFIPCFFCIDHAGRFLITDRKQPYVYVVKRGISMEQALETRLELEHGEDRLAEPRGVCLDREGRVIVVCNYKNAMLQIF